MNQIDNSIVIRGIRPSEFYLRENIRQINMISVVWRTWKQSFRLGLFQALRIEQKFMNTIPLLSRYFFICLSDFYIQQISKAHLYERRQ